MLTAKQRDLLLYINDHMDGSDVAPSFEEMKNALNLKSKSGIHRLISALVERGYIERLPHRARALRILQLPEDAKPKTTNLPENTVQHVNFSDNSMPKGAMQTIPLMGKIAAGTPIEAIREEDTLIHIPAELSGRSESYALTVDGDSMVEAGIHDGDTVIIERCSNAPAGTIIVALVDGEEVTLKRLRYAGNKVVLEPENAAYEPQILDANRVQIQGRLTGLMRTYH